ncbi:hypothetical protein, partial [Mesorhizobium sp. M8A.F.Ca.ET.142.01.1.1]|uniref:hypothetical protein n=1 Tax=Mesorhizobium sp. M8A.F.Ca.ET.142.01.1.1 TaxID=2563958 RepID=UPI001AEEBA0B
MLLDFLWQGAARLRELARQGRVAAEATCDGGCRRHRASVPHGDAVLLARAPWRDASSLEIGAVLWNQAFPK